MTAEKPNDIRTYYFLNSLQTQRDTRASHGGENENDMLGGKLCRVILRKLTDVSEVLDAPNIRAMIAELLTASIIMAMIALMMEAVSTSEMSVNLYETTQCYIREDCEPRQTALLLY
jgi:hypothetical protein